MPIRPEYRWLYPIDWPQLSAVIRFQRAGGALEPASPDKVPTASSNEDYRRTD